MFVVSGTCKAFNVTEDFDRFIDLKEVDKKDEDFFGLKRVKLPGDPINTIIEFDYIENKHSYERGERKNGKEFDVIDNPVIEILFSADKSSHRNCRLGNFIIDNFYVKGSNYTIKYEISVLGEKLNRLAYLQVTDFFRTKKTFNNYSPDLPSWPFAIRVAISMYI